MWLVDHYYIANLMGKYLWKELGNNDSLLHECTSHTSFLINSLINSEIKGGIWKSYFDDLFVITADINQYFSKSIT